MGTNVFTFIISNDRIMIAGNGFGDTLAKADNNFKNYALSILQNDSLASGSAETNTQIIELTKSNNNSENYSTENRLTGSNSRNISQNPDDKARFNGGGSKPASTKQINCIKKIANEKHIDVERYIADAFNKPLNKITGAEANIAINDIKER